MTTGASADQGHEDLFVADFYPLLGEYLAGQHVGGYDVGAGRARFLAWLSQHTDDGEPVGDYLKQVSEMPRLSAEHEADLARRIEAGRYAGQKLAEGGSALSADARTGRAWIAEDGMRARNQLIEANFRLVVSLAKRYSGRGLLFPDLIQAGNLGLIRAVEKFDHTKGYQFATYATWWIRQAITRAMADPEKVIGVRSDREPISPPHPAARIHPPQALDAGRRPSRNGAANATESAGPARTGWSRNGSAG
jgi:hypothetical protein